MSKKTRKLATQQRGVAAKKNIQTRGREKFSDAPARGYKRPARAGGLSAATVRVAAWVVAGLALAGGIALAVTAQGSDSTGAIVGLIALGFLIGLALMTAFKPDGVTQMINRRIKR